MAEIVRIERNVGAPLDRYQCGVCKETFYYGPGFPFYCPECGEKVTATDDKAS